MIVKENIKELEIRCPQEGDTQSQADEDTKSQKQDYKNKTEKFEVKLINVRFLGVGNNFSN